MKLSLSVGDNIICKGTRIQENTLLAIGFVKLSKDRFRLDENVVQLINDKVVYVTQLPANRICILKRI